MKKLVLLGLAIVSTASGCGHGWLPFRGAMCRGNCVGSAPSYNDCQDCGSGVAGYQGYEGEQVVDNGIVDNGYMGGGVVSQPWASSPTNIAPSMNPLPRP